MGKDQSMGGVDLPALDARKEKDGVLTKYTKGDKTTVKLTPWPAEDRVNPYAGLHFDTYPYKNS